MSNYTEEEIAMAIRNLEAAYIAGMDEEFRDDVRTLLDFAALRTASQGDDEIDDETSCAVGSPEWQRGFNAGLEQGRREIPKPATPASANEAVPYGHFYTDDPAVYAYAGCGFSLGPERPKDAVNVLPLYTHPAPASTEGPQVTDEQVQRALKSYDDWFFSSEPSELNRIDMMRAALETLPARSGAVDLEQFRMVANWARLHALTPEFKAECVRILAIIDANKQESGQ